MNRRSSRRAHAGELKIADPEPAAVDCAWCGGTACVRWWDRARRVTCSACNQGRDIRRTQ